MSRSVPSLRVALVAVAVMLDTTPGALRGQTVGLEPGGTAVGVALSIPWPVAPRDMALAAAARRTHERLAGWSTVAALAIECSPDGLILSFAATPDTWQDAVRAWALRLSGAMYPPAADVPATARPDRPANPAAEFDVLLERARRSGEPDARCLALESPMSPPTPAPPPIPTPPTARSDPPTAPTARSEHVRPVRAAWALFGPVEEEPSRTLMDALFDSPAAALGEELRAAVPARGPVHLERATVSTWIGIAYPITSQPPPESVELLAFRLEERLRAAIGREMLFEVQAEVVRGARSEWLQLRLLTDAGAASAVERAAREAVAGAAVWVPSPVELDALRARFRGARLLDLATPEARAREALINPAFRAGNVSAAIARLQPPDMEAAALALGPPLVVRVGPR